MTPHWSFLRTKTHVSCFGALSFVYTISKCLMNLWQMKNKKLGFSPQIWGVFYNYTLPP